MENKKNATLTTMAKVKYWDVSFGLNCFKIIPLKTIVDMIEAIQSRTVKKLVIE